MVEDALRELEAALADSDFLRVVASVRDDGGVRYALGSAELRPLSADEVRRLERQGNACADWSRVLVAVGFDAARVQHSSLFGDVVLGRFARALPVEDGVELPSGVYRSTLSNCVVGHDALVRDVRLLANCVVAEAAVLFDCGGVTCEAETAFGSGAALPIGVETGGRDVRVYADMSLPVAAAVARNRCKAFLARYAELVGQYAARARCDRGIVGRGAAVLHTPKVKNTFLGSGARVEGAQVVSDSTVLSRAAEPVRVESGAAVSRSLLQWGSRVSTMAVVDRSVLVEYSYAERHGNVTASILGPNTGVAEGEVTSSLVGPFVGFHHQALLIGAVWPEGKGNVAYGANVGSNHTTKAPDQEFFPGEGLFLGLGVNIKYPADFTRAPYSIIACGVTALPQKVTFPFSLINVPAAVPPGISPAYNEIVPAWLLAHNPYTLRRNEEKFRARNQARRSAVEFEVFRPQIVDLMRDACRRLEGVPRVRETYTEKEIPGLGKNFLSESGRKAAIEAYRFYIRLYALRGLKEHAQAAVERGDAAAVGELLATPSGAGRWEHQRQILCEDEGFRDPVAALLLLADMLEEFARDVEASRGKDDERGRRIIEDYADVHAPAGDDPVVARTWEEARRGQREVQELVEALEKARAAGAAAPLWPFRLRPVPVG